MIFRLKEAVLAVAVALTTVVVAPGVPNFVERGLELVGIGNLECYLVRRWAPEVEKVYSKLKLSLVGADLGSQTFDLLVVLTTVSICFQRRGKRRILEQVQQEIPR